MQVVVLYSTPVVAIWGNLGQLSKVQSIIYGNKWFVNPLTEAMLGHNGDWYSV